MIPEGVTVLSNFLDDNEATALFNALLAEVTWRQDHMRMFARRVPLPRLTAWYGDPGATYKYSGVTNVAQPWTASLAAIKPRLDALLPRGLTFNGVLLNYYRDGRDKVGYHADDEPELGDEPFIVSLSLGATRRFLMRPKAKGSKEVVTIPLDNGTLVVMQGRCQKEWIHSVPPEKVAGPRINLTLRRVMV